MIDVSHYAYRVQWSTEDAAFVATAAELPSLSWLAASQCEALDGLVALIAGVVADLEANGEEIPAPLADREFSGRFNVRLPPALHRQLVVDAAHEGISLNRLAAYRLARPR